MIRSPDGTPHALSFTWNDETGAGAGKRTKTSHISSHSTPSTTTTTTSLSSWDIDGGLAADFDGSLSGLGTELGTSSYNMSEALLALPVFKQENLESGFQYILGAATSPAVKMNEETLTYLNQGQSYEIKLKKLGDLSEYQGKFLRSQVKVLFHERRLQYMEREQIEAWKRNRPGERILDIDVPLSYALIDMNLDAIRLNQTEFIWDPTKETGVYIRVHCISTEFTAKKHGGEKGVPFRIQVETYSNGPDSKLLHCASCQVKVFKPKGADRKHKTDREKMEKRSEAEKEKYQPSYECTVLTEVPLDQVLAAQASQLLKSPTNISPSVCSITTVPSTTDSPTPVQPLSPSPATPSPPTHLPSRIITSTPQVLTPEADQTTTGPLPGDSTSQEVARWLHFNRFTSYTRVFQNFSGADLLRLSRDDLIQICGLADGIRLDNALQSRAVRPRLTLYVCQEVESGELIVYHAVYLEAMTVMELSQKLSLLFGIQRSQIGDIYIQGPSGIHVLVTDEVIHNVGDQTRFAVEGMKDDGSDKYKILLKTVD
ncbi:transcription factor CP2-like isoform X1 [Haliotis rubra]|uniref:transcription factor CP2-like isoform X1 n=1 Tax=Haliotis rubra TaxID=36100 RepID=UPI001EE52506|nr:transcription factor CP2-like isoform X1 [Haliotis rubra]